MKYEKWNGGNHKKNLNELLGILQIATDIN